ncbi:hypothetical protein VE03_00050 [Pseudogymnoascus sp. 23342-1-I1]|nr:hypothetical protein VE03_00050 [Pseudogymnoascus sp. 23342-1-I1]
MSCTPRQVPIGYRRHEALFGRRKVLKRNVKGAQDVEDDVGDEMVYNAQSKDVAAF